MFWLENGVIEEYQSGFPEGPERYRTVSSERYTRATVVADIMSQPVQTVEASQSLAEAEDIMTELGIAHLAVLDKDQFSGLLSDRDILRAEFPYDFVGQHMSRQLLLASPKEKISRVAAIMAEHHVHCVPILDEQFFLVGMLTTTDILGCMTYQAPLEFWC